MVIAFSERRSMGKQLMVLRAFFLIGVIIALHPCQSAGELPGGPTFDFVSQAIRAAKQQEVFASWNPDSRSPALAPGFKVLFFGEGSGCRLDSANGPVESSGNPHFDRAMEVTGVPLATSATEMRWTPSAKTLTCKDVTGVPIGDSFIHVNPDTYVGGIGLFTATGDNLGDQERSYFEPFGAAGRGGRGFNPHIEGTFVNFRFDWRGTDLVQPWFADSAAGVETALELHTVQSVIAYTVGDATVQNDGSAIQAKQQLMLTVINPFCFREMRAASRLCQVQYLFNIALYRSDVHDWDSVPWAKHAGVFLDPGQGGMPVVRGLLRDSDNGDVHARTREGLSLYSSLKGGSQHALFLEREFGIHITFEQFMNALFEIAAKTLRKAAADVSCDDIRSLYGSRWDDRSQWVLLSLHVGQEIYNPNGSDTAMIGGNVRALSVVGVSEGSPSTADRVESGPQVVSRVEKQHSSCCRRSTIRKVNRASPAR